MCGYFHILIVSAVKTRKQYLRTAVASEGLHPPDSHRGFALGPPWASPDPLGSNPQIKNPVTVTSTAGYVEVK